MSFKVMYVKPVWACEETSGIAANGSGSLLCSLGLRFIREMVDALLSEAENFF